MLVMASKIIAMFKQLAGDVSFIASYIPLFRRYDAYLIRFIQFEYFAL